MRLPETDAFVKKTLFMLSLVVAICFHIAVSSTIYSYYSQDNDSHRGIDFYALLTGAKILKSDPQKLYDLEKQKEVQQEILGVKALGGVLSFRNSPLVAYMYSFYLNTTPVKAYRINYFIEVILTGIFIAAVYLVTKTSKWFIPLAISFPPSIYQSFYGHVSILIGFIFLLIAYFLKKGTSSLATGAAGSLFILKFQYLLSVPYLFIVSKKKLKYTLGFLLGFLIIILIESRIVGFLYLPGYIKFLVNSETSKTGVGLLALYNITAFLRIFKLPEVTIFWINSSLTILSFVLLYFSKSSYREIAIIPLVLALNPHTALVDLVFLLIPIAMLLAQKSEQTRRTRAFFIIVGVLWLIPWLSKTSFQGVGGIIMLLVSLYLLANKHQKIKI